jgi:hypothetical protein
MTMLTKLLISIGFASALFAISAWAATVTVNIPITVSSSAQAIASIALSANSFTGGAAQGTTVGTVTVTMSPASPPFSGTLSLTGTARGSGNDANSFQTSGTSLQVGAGTSQPGQYAINIVATQAGTTNGSLSQAEAISATGPGGAGWQLAFSDEFSDANGMLQNLSTVSASAYTWTNAFCAGLSSPSAKGCGTLTVASLPSGISSATCSGAQLGACSISISGATNVGTGGNAAVNGTFLVVNATSTTITLYMPYNGISTSMGGTIIVGSGQWVNSLVTSCNPGPCNGLPLLASNDNGGEAEGWDPHACAVTGGNFKINITKTGTRYINASGSPTANYIPPTSMQQAGNTYANTTCHIQTWTGSAGATQGQEVFFDSNIKIPVGGPHTSMFTLTASNLWNNGPEEDIPECFSVSGCFWHEISTGTNQAITSQDYSAAFHQFGADITNTTVTFFLDGSSSFSHSHNDPTNTLWYPLLDVAVDGGGGNATDNSSLSANYIRIYKKVATGACYSSIPSTTTIPHVGTC